MLDANVQTDYKGISTWDKGYKFQKCTPSL